MDTQHVSPGSILNRLVEGKILEPSSLAFLKASLDPWHDTKIDNLKGVPDMKVGKSLVYDYVSELQIAKNTSPSPLPVGNWSCRIGNLPTSTYEPVRSATCYGALLLNGVLDNLAVSNVMVTYAQDGADHPDTGLLAAPAAAQFLQIPPDFLQGQATLIGMGIEVINTTPDLTSSGFVFRR